MSRTRSPGWMARRSSLASSMAVAVATSASTAAAVTRELEGVREQIFQNLLQALGVRVDRARQVRQELDDELEPLGLGQMIERPLDEAVEIREPHLAHVDDDGPRLDLGQVEDVV